MTSNLSLLQRSLKPAVQTLMPLCRGLERCRAVGIRSIAIAVLTAIFSSRVMTVQFAVQMARFGVKEYVSSVVSLSLVRELGPVLTASLLADGAVRASLRSSARCGSPSSSMPCAMGADPVRKLVVPRVLATTIVLPLLAVLAHVLGVLGAMIIARLNSDVGMTLCTFHRQKSFLWQVSIRQRLRANVAL